VPPSFAFEAVRTTVADAPGWLELDEPLELEEYPVPELLLPHAANVNDTARAGTSDLSRRRINAGFRNRRNWFRV
jgi:hypothetical protein